MVGEGACVWEFETLWPKLHLAQAGSVAESNALCSILLLIVHFLLSIDQQCSAILSNAQHGSELFSIPQHSSALLSFAQYYSALLSTAKHCSVLLRIV